MKTFATAVFAFVLASSGMSLGGEHPKEHPTGKSKHEHPKKEEQKKKWVEHKETMKAFVEAVESHVAAKASEEDSFKVHDDKLDKTWELELVKVHKNRIARLAEDKFFACADFKTVGKGESAKLDLDFFVTHDGDDWNVDEVLVHKVEGKPRYTYDGENRRVPAGADGKPERSKVKKGKKAKHEHPSGQEHPSGSEHPH